MTVEVIEGQVVDVVVWVCPTPGCGNYYAASSVRDLASEDQSSNGGKPSGRSRATCPACAQKEIVVERQPIPVSLSLPRLDQTKEDR